MTARILRTELRRSTAPWIGVLFALCMFGLLYGLTGPWVHGTARWDEQWNGLGMWLRNLLTFCWPVVLGLGAWQGTRQRRSTMDELLASTARPAWRRTGVLALAVTIALALAWVVLFVVGAIDVAGDSGYFSGVGPVTVLVGLVATAAAALLGMAIGHLLPYLATPPVLAVAGIVLMAVTLPQPDHPLPDKVLLLAPAVDGPLTPYMTLGPSVHIGQLLAYSGLAATGIGMLATRGLRGRLLAILPALTGLALALTILPNDMRTAYPDDPAAMAPVCADAERSVCVTAAHAPMLAQIADSGRRALADLAVLPNAPVRVREVPSTRRHGEPYAAQRPADAVPVDIDDRETRLWKGIERFDAERLRLSMLVGAGTPRCMESDDAELAARLAVVGWLDGDPEQPVAAVEPRLLRIEPEAVAKAELARRSLLALPHAEQVRRVAAVRSAGLSCDRNPWDALMAGTDAR